MGRLTIAPERLRWKAEARSIEHGSTRDYSILRGTIGQELAYEALRYAILSPGAGQHVFVRGRQGSRRRKLIESVLAGLEPEPRQARDFCFVHNFANPDRPRLIVLPEGKGRTLQHHMHRIGLFVRERLPEILDNDPIRGRREARKAAAEREIQLLLRPFEKQLEQDGLGLIRSQSGPNARLEIGVKVMGKPVSAEEFRNMVARKQASEEERSQVNERIEKHQRELQHIARQIRRTWQQAEQRIEQINNAEAARLLGEMSAEISEKIDAAGIDSFLRDVIDDVLEKRVGHDTAHLADPTMIYGVNVLRKEIGNKKAPVIVPNLISAGNLFGSVDPAWRSGERAVASFRGIHAGALIEADGGFLVLDAEDLVSQPQLFQRLLRNLRTGTVDILAPTPDWSHAAQSLKPEAVPVDCGVIVFGDERAYRRLLEISPELGEQFGIVADLDELVERDKEGIEAFCRLLATVVHEQSLLPLDHTALAAMIEYGARESDRPSHLQAHPNKLSAIVREASFIAGENSKREVTRDEIEQALQQKRDRAGLARHRFLDQIRHGHTTIQLRGKAAGCINTMTLHSNAGTCFALPSQIVCSIAGAGNQQITKWSRESAPMDNDRSGLLDHLVAQLLRLDRPVHWQAAFEFHYLHTGEDADATLLAQACALVTRLADTPVRQDIAVVGQIDLNGRIRPASHINDRIEGFFEACNQSGISGQQGVIIPKANAAGLVLDPAVVSASNNDTFQVLAVDTLNQALELITGQRPGTWGDGGFPEESVLGRARHKAMGPETGQPR